MRASTSPVLSPSPDSTLLHCVEEGGLCLVLTCCASWTAPLRRGKLGSAWCCTVGSRTCCFLNDLLLCKCSQVLSTTRGVCLGLLRHCDARLMEVALRIPTVENCLQNLTRFLLPLPWPKLHHLFSIEAEPCGSGIVRGMLNWSWSFSSGRPNTVGSNNVAVDTME